MTHFLPSTLLRALRFALLCVCGCVPLLAPLACEEADPRDAMADALFDRMACEDGPRPSTLKRLREALEDPGLDTAAAFALNPQDLASIVSLAGPQAEAVVVVTRNVWSVAESGLGRTFIDEVAGGTFDGVTCGDSLPIECTAGSGTSTVECDDDGAAFAVVQELSLCTLHGIVFQGTVLLSKDASQAQHLRVDVNGLAIDEATAVDGVLDVTLQPDRNEGFSLRLVEPFAVKDHGGRESGLSCGQELNLDVLDLVVDGATTRFGVDGFHHQDDRSVGLRSEVGHDVVFDGSCGCPRPGSALSFVIPRPLGSDTETSTAHVVWGDGDAHSCASVSVAIDDWTNACDVIDGVDCGRGAVEVGLAALLQTLCFVP